MLFLDNYSYIEHRVLDTEIEELENNKSYYINEIKKDSTKIKQLKNGDQIEKYARENKLDLYYLNLDSKGNISFEDLENVLKNGKKTFRIAMVSILF